MLGYAVSGGKTVRNDDGTPVVRAEPILSREDFEALRTELAKRQRQVEPSERSISLLLRVLHCGVCGEPYYRSSGGSRNQFIRYRCRSMSHPKLEKCGNSTVRQDTIDRRFEDLLLALLDESEHKERVWDAGSDHSAELAEINAELADLAGQLGTGMFKLGTPQRDRLDQRIAGLVARQEALSTQAVKPAGWTEQPTGEKFSEWWARQDTSEKNTWLRSRNVRLEFSRGEFNLDFGDIFTLTQDMIVAGPLAGAQKILNKMRDTDIAGFVLDDEDIRVVQAPLGQD